MIHHGTRISFNGVKGSEATVFIFGDRQQGSKGYKKEAWEEFKREFLATPNAWALGVGDYGDWLRPSMRTPVVNALAKDDSARAMLDGDIRRGHDEIINDMAFLEGKLIGLHEGHHNWTFASGETTDQRLASALKAPYLGWIATTRLVFTTGNDDRAKGGHSFVHMLLSTHGNANGRKVPAALANLENYTQSWDADSFVMGHGCKSGNHVPFKRNKCRRIGPFGVETQIPRCMVVGGFCEGYTDGWQSSYVERAGFLPQPLGYGIFRFKRVSRMDNQIIRGVKNKHTHSLMVEPVNRVLEF